MIRFTCVQLNADFTDRRTDLPYVIERRGNKRRRLAERPWVVFGQETVREDWSRLAPAGWATAQDMSTEATRGVAVTWDTAHVEAVGDWRCVLLLPERPGVIMRGRWIIAQDVRIGGQVVTLASTHRPPERYAHLWPEFDRALAAWVRRQQHPVILGIDTNVPGLRALKPGRRRRLARSLGMRQAGYGIDAVMVTPPLRVKPVRWLPKRTSDHRGVEVQVTIPSKRSK